MKSQPSKKRFIAALAGTLLIALCCFTPVLVITLGALGLSAFTPYLDYVLFPALGIMAVVTALAYKKWQTENSTVRETYECSVCKLKYDEKAWADKCEKWCTEHQSCNLDIIKHSRQ